MAHESHQYRVLLATNEGALHISLYPDSHPAKPAQHFIKLVEDDVYDGSQLQSILPKFFVEFTPHKIGPTLSNSPHVPTVSFDKAGVVALGPKNQLVISLDRCDAIEQKYFVIGEIDDQDVETLVNIGLYETDANHLPFTALQIMCAKILQNKTPGSPDVNPKKRKGTFKEPAPALQRQTTSPFKRRKTEISPPTSSTALAPPPTGSDAFDLSKQASIINDEQQAIKSSPVRAALQQADPSLLLASRSMSMPDLRSLNIPPKWPSRLVIIRHGESEQNAVLDLPQIAENIDAIARIRDADVKLTQRGVLQARHTGLYLSKTEKFDICFVSPYLRTRATAEEIARQLPYNVKVYSDNTLREKEFGRLHGLQAVHVKDRFPEEYKARERDGKYWYRFPGGENYPDVEMRVMSFLERLSREYAGRSVLVVTHQVPYKMIRAVLQHLDENQVLSLDAVANCGVQEYILDRRKSPEGRLKLKTFNFVAYDADVVEKETTFQPTTSSSSSSSHSTPQTPTK